MLRIPPIEYIGLPKYGSVTLWACAVTSTQDTQVSDWKGLEVEHSSHANAPSTELIIQ
jgi:hypothetical protein